MARMSAARSLSPSGQTDRLTVEEYLAFEASSPVRHEYDRGLLVKMAGGTVRHSQIKSDLVRELGNQLGPGGCNYFDSDMRVRVRDDRYVYPDASATCRPPETVEGHDGTSLANPQAVFEVLSEGSEAYDRGRKFHDYLQIESVRDYVLLAQDRPRMEVISRREPGGDFRLRISEGEAEAAEVPSLGVSLRLAEVYRQVRFEDDAAEDSEGERGASTP